MPGKKLPERYQQTEKLFMHLILNNFLIKLPFRKHKPNEKQNFVPGISAAMFDPALLLHGTRTNRIAP